MMNKIREDVYYLLVKASTDLNELKIIIKDPKSDLKDLGDGLVESLSSVLNSIEAAKKNLENI